MKNVVYASSEIDLRLALQHAAALLARRRAVPRQGQRAPTALSKLLAEQMAEQFCRWDPELKMFGLRFSNVQLPEDYANFPGFQTRPYERRWNLWGYIDARDGAQAVRKALESRVVGAEVFVVANAETVVPTSQRRPRQALLRRARHSPTASAPNDSLLSIEKARRLLGYEPQHHWWAEQEVAQ